MSLKLPVELRTLWSGLIQRHVALEDVHNCGSSSRLVLLRSHGPKAVR
jgi:hypothetical protein